jgi:hypothetical protein
MTILWLILGAVAILPAALAALAWAGSSRLIGYVPTSITNGSSASSSITWPKQQTTAGLFSAICILCDTYV